MSVAECLAEIGGVSTRATLVALTSRAGVDRALAAGDIVADARGRYALPAASEARRAANRLTGVSSHLSAALEHGWEVKFAPSKPHITLPKSRKVRFEQRRGVVIHRANLLPDQIDGSATTKDQTLLDCLRSLPFDEALSVADSALRHGDITEVRLAALARAAKGPGAPAIRRVASAADARAANPFESVLRATAIEVDGLEVVPQVGIGGVILLGRPDLVDAALRIVLEADSFEWHGDKAALEKDTRRYNSFVVNGWLVLRFAWKDVMHDPAWVTEILKGAVLERTQVCRCLSCAA